MDLTHPPHDPNRDPNDHDPNHDAVDRLIDCASQAEDAMRQLARRTLHPPTLTLADIERILGHLAESVAALPQVAAQVSRTLDRSRAAYDPAVEGTTATTDPHLAIDSARLHLDEARHPALATYRRLNAARTELAHISATPTGDLEGSPPRSPRRRLEDRQTPARQEPARQEPARQEPASGSRGPAR